MNPQINVIVIGVADVDRAKHFYAEGLGCSIQQDHGQFVMFTLGDGSSRLALYPRETLAGDAGVPAEGSGFTGVTFHHIVESPEEVDEALNRAEKAGATIVRSGQEAAWGGYFGYFADLDGNLWKATCSA